MLLLKLVNYRTIEKIVAHNTKLVHIAPHNTFIYPKSFFAGATTMRENAKQMLTDFLKRFKEGEMVIELDHADFTNDLLLQSKACDGGLNITHFIPGRQEGVVDISTSNNVSTSNNGPTFGSVIDSLINMQEEIEAKEIEANPNPNKRKFIVTLDAKTIRKKKDCKNYMQKLKTRFETINRNKRTKFYLRLKEHQEHQENASVVGVTTMTVANCKEPASDKKIKTYYASAWDNTSFITQWRNCQPDYPSFDVFSIRFVHLMMRATFLTENGMFCSQRLPLQTFKTKEISIKVDTDLSFAYYSSDKTVEVTARANNQKTCEINKELPVICAKLKDKHPESIKLFLDAERFVKFETSHLEGEPESNLTFRIDNTDNIQMLTIGQKPNKT